MNKGNRNRTEEENERIREKILEFRDTSIEVSNQEWLVNKLIKECKLTSFSQPALSRILTKDLGLRIKDGYLVEKDTKKPAPNKAKLEKLFRMSRPKFLIVSDLIIFLQIKKEYSYQAQTYLKGSFPKLILGVFSDEDGNLLIITNSISNRNELRDYFNYDLKLFTISEKNENPEQK